MIAQRTVGLCLGYEDTNDHDELRRDPLLATVCGKLDPSGQNRRHARDRGKALAGKSTLNRLETYGAGRPENLHYKKIYYSPEALNTFFVDTFLNSIRKPPRQIVLDIDATDDPLHGHQQGRFFHGYYDCYCYLPLYIFCGDHLLTAKLKTANLDPGHESLPDIQQVVARIRRRWPKVRIILRFVSFLPAISGKAAKRVRATMRSWKLAATRNNQNLEDLALLIDPPVRGWMNYYGRFYRSECVRVLRHLNRLLVKWACRKFRRFRRRERAAGHWLGCVARRDPKLLALWTLGVKPAAWAVRAV